MINVTDNGDGTYTVTVNKYDHLVGWADINGEKVLAKFSEHGSLGLEDNELDLVAEIIRLLGKLNG